jgi:hypothetical protein
VELWNAPRHSLRSCPRREFIGSAAAERYPLGRHRSILDVKLIRILRAVARWLAHNWPTVLGWSETLGGLALAFDAVIEWRGARSTDFPPWHLPAALSFAALSVLAGVLLLRGHQFGRLLSIVVQAAQLGRVTATGISVRVAAGLVATLWYGHPGGWDKMMGVAATFRAGRAPVGHVEIGINFVALVAVYALARQRRSQPE